jgi:hypothetical protein
MSSINRTGTVFIREDTRLPATLAIESEAFLPGWRVVKNLDRQALIREVEGANWNFFYLAGEMRATVFGREGLGALREAVKCVLAKQEGQKFNSVEITKIVAKRFRGIPFMSVTAHSRHIQQGIGLVPAKDFVLRMPAAPNREVATKQYTALFSSS